MARKNDSNAAVTKVAQAADSGNRRDIPLFTRLGFPALIGLICILGIANVTYFKATRAEVQRPVQNVDHWHAVYGIWDCTANSGEGGYLASFQSALDPLGIHSHQDGIMHIHPFFDAADGPDAQLKVFFEAMNVDLADTSITLDDGRKLANGMDCGGEDAQLHVRKWQFDFTADSSEPEVITTGLGDVRYLNDREVYIIAFAPLDSEIPLPPNQRFEQLNAVAGSLQSTGPVTEDDLTNPAFDVEGAPEGNSFTLNEGDTTIEGNIADDLEIDVDGLDAEGIEVDADVEGDN